MASLSDNGAIQYASSRLREIIPIKRAVKSPNRDKSRQITEIANNFIEVVHPIIRSIRGGGSARGGARKRNKREREEERERSCPRSESSRERVTILFSRYFATRSLSSDVRPAASLCARFRAIRRVIVCIANVQPTPPTVRHTGERRQSVHVLRGNRPRVRVRCYI